MVCLLLPIGLLISGVHFREPFICFNFSKAGYDKWLPQKPHSNLRVINCLG